MKRLLLTGVAALSLFTAAEARATEDFCAVVIKPPPEVTRDKEYNPDGWLALRVYPIRQSKMIAKLREGDFLFADTHTAEHCASNKPDCSREWTYVTGVPRIDGPSNPNKTWVDYTHGWVRSKYIQSFVCPEDQEAQVPDPPKPSSITDPPKPVLPAAEIPTTDNPNPTSKWTSVTSTGPVNLPSAMLGSWCYSEGPQVRQIYIRNEGKCIGTKGVLTVWPDGYGGLNGTCTITKMEKLAANVYLIKSNCKGLGLYDGATWMEDVELQINDGKLRFDGS